MLEKALEKKKRAEAVLEERGIKDVDPANIPKLLGKISVKEKLEYEYSVGKARIAEEQAEDAASKQRLAEAFYEIDKKSLEFEMKKFALKMAALFNLC